MEAGRVRNLDSKMKGTINQENKLTDIYLPRKCDYTDRIITSKDHSSIQLQVADVTIPLPSSTRTEPSTSARPAPSASQDSSDPLERVTLPSRKSSRKGNSSDRTWIYFTYHQYHPHLHHVTLTPLPIFPFYSILLHPSIHPSIQLQLSNEIKKFINIRDADGDRSASRRTLDPSSEQALAVVHAL
jgi:hypothetical protein